MSEPRKEKKFDCVRMKHEIQQDILRRMEGMSPEEQRRWTKELIEKDEFFGPLWRSARRSEHPTRKAS